MLKLTVILWLVTTMLHCQEHPEIDYDLENPDRTIELPKRLKEISGLSYASNHLFAVQDEKGNLYQINLENESIEKFDFAKDGDYEAVEVVDTFIYAFTSKASMYRIKILGPDSVAVIKLAPFISKDQNLEGLTFDPENQQLLIASKRRKSDESKEILSYDIHANRLSDHTLFQIDIQEMSNQLGHPVKGFNPSAIALHPMTKELYVLSHPEQQLLIVDIRKGHYLKLMKLNQQMFIQPEGICFDGRGTLFISSEGENEIPGRIFVFSPLRNK